MHLSVKRSGRGGASSKSRGVPSLAPVSHTLKQGIPLRLANLPLNQILDDPDTMAFPQIHGPQAGPRLF